MPSARFRVRQYLPFLANHGVLVDEFSSRAGAYPPPEPANRFAWGVKSLLERVPAVFLSHNHDVTFLQRELLSTLVTLEPFTKKPRILDVDDAIWIYRDGTTAKRLAQMCDLIVCGNTYLADWFAQWNKNVQIIPTGVNTANYVPTPKAPKQTCVIGWIGTSPGFPYLYWLEECIEFVLRRNPDAVFRIVSSSQPAFKRLPVSQLQFYKWTPEREVSEIQHFDIGIMPLLDTELARGKCAFKLLQYLACGIPAVVSPVGMNSEILTHTDAAMSAQNKDEWVDALNYLLGNPSVRMRMGLRGRDYVVGNFDSRFLAKSLAAAIHSVA